MKKLDKFVENLNSLNEAAKAEETFDGKKEKDIAELNPKTDDSVMKFAPVIPEHMGKNERRVQVRIERRQPFFIIGHAGWAKSSVVKKVAKRNGIELLVVNLDKACKEDLGGIPTPVKNSRGRDSVKFLPLPWMEEIMDNPDKEYLVFFDEMNQADPDVMNALMPIVEDHALAGIRDIKNFFCCGAGNYQEENKGGVHELSTPLLSRFKPIIIWEDNTEDAWKDTFEFFHEIYDSIFGKEFIDKFWDYHNLFECPRELSSKIWDQYINVKKMGIGSAERYKPEYIAEEIAGESEDGYDSLLKRDIDSRDRKKYSREMAQLIHDWLVDDGEGQEAITKKRGRKAGSKDISIDEDSRKLIESGMRKGYIDGRVYGQDNILYVVSEENIYKIFDPDVVNPEGIKQWIKHVRQLGVDFKYKTTQEAINELKKTASAQIVDPASDEAA